MPRPARSVATQGVAGLSAAGNVSPVDLDLVQVVDDPAEVVRIITDAHSHQGLAPEDDL